MFFLSMNSHYINDHFSFIFPLDHEIKLKALIILNDIFLFLLESFNSSFEYYYYNSIYFNIEYEFNFKHDKKIEPKY